MLNIIISAKGSQFLHLACQGEGAGRPLLPRLETGIKNQILLEKTEVGILIPFNWFDSCNDSFFPAWNSHCTRVRFTVIVLCSDELAVHSCPLLCLQKWVAKVTSGLFYCWSLVRNNTMATNLQNFALYCGSRRFVAWDCWMYTSWQVVRNRKFGEGRSRDSEILERSELDSESDSLPPTPQPWS